MKPQTFKTYVLTPLLSTALGISTLVSFSPQLSAQEAGVYFHPAKSWVLASNKDSGEQRCVLSTSFNNGFDVRFTGTQKWVQSLDIDFQQSAFETGKVYDVKLGTPSGQNVTAKARAMSDTVLSIDLSQRKNFYKTIRNAPVMDFNIDDNDFRFYMTGFSAKADGFERCMAGGEERSAPVQTAAFSQSSALVLGASDKDFTPSTANDVNPSQMYEDKENATLALKKLRTITVPSIPPAPAKATIAEKVPSPSVPKVNTTQTQTAPETPKTAIDYRRMAATQLGLATPVKAETAENTTPAETVVIAHAETAPKTQSLNKDIEFKSTGRRMSETLNAQIMADPTLADVADNPKMSDAGLKAQAVAQTSATTAVKSETRLPSVTPLPTPTQARPPITPKVQPLPEKEILPPRTTPVGAPIGMTDMIQAERAPVSSMTPSPQPTMLAKNTTSATDTNVIDFTDAPEQAFTPAGMKTTSTIKPYEPLKATPAPVTENIRTEIKVAKVEASGEMDYRHVDRYAEAKKRADERLAKLEQKIQNLEQENTALNSDLRNALSASREETMSVSSENWNLEKAATRYNEAERQLRKLGQQLQQERAQCAVEKEELETMLFDPQVTNQQQMAKLADLTRQLEEAQRTLQDQRMRYEERIRMLER